MPCFKTRGDQPMNIGSLVKYKAESGWHDSFSVGIITGFCEGRALIYWSIRFPYEEEYLEQLVVIG